MLGELFIDHGRRAPAWVRWFRATLVFILSAAMLAVLIYETRLTYRLATWTPTRCSILDSRVSANSTDRVRERPYELQVLFAYSFGGSAYTGRKYSRSGLRSEDVAEVDAVARTLPRGSTVTCFVDPQNPGGAVLVRKDPRWLLGATAVGAVVLLGVIFGYCLPQVKPARPVRPHTRLRGVLAGLLVAAGGGVWFTLQYGVPMVQSVQAAHWPIVPCTIVETNLISREERGEVPITLYRTDILYRYRRAGVDYLSNCYRPSESSTPFKSGRARRVGQYKAGQQATCRVDPGDPSVAALAAGLSPSCLIGMFPLLVSAFGAAAALPRSMQARLGRQFARNKWTLATLAVGMAAWILWSLVTLP